MNPALPSRVLAVGAIVLAALAPFAGSPHRGGSPDVAGVAAPPGRGETPIAAVDLAGWIKDRKVGLRVIDVRSPEEFAVLHIPVAENVSLESLARTTFHSTDTIVLYSEEEGPVGEACVALRARGQEHLFFLRGGLSAWLDDVMNPVLGSAASEGERRAFERVAALSRYFGGVPRMGDAAPSSASKATRTEAAPRSASPTETAALRTRRRGC